MKLLLLENMNGAILYVQVDQMNFYKMDKFNLGERWPLTKDVTSSVSFKETTVGKYFFNLICQPPPPPPPQKKKKKKKPNKKLKKNPPTTTTNKQTNPHIHQRPNNISRSRNKKDIGIENLSPSHSKLNLLKTLNIRRPETV